eukprot:7523875-Alexandrium_andersonii.AAC.1
MCIRDRGSTIPAQDRFVHPSLYVRRRAMPAHECVAFLRVVQQPRRQQLGIPHGTNVLPLVIGLVRV